MTYNEFILNIITTRGQWSASLVLYENHHIVPRCQSGLPTVITHTTKHDNLIWLTPQEHYEAHRLLALENPMDTKLVWAFKKMSIHHKEFITADDYAFLKSNLHLSAETKAKISKSNLGKNVGKVQTEETKEKIRQAMLGRTCTEEHKNKVRLSKLGKKRGPMSEEQKQKISKANLGKSPANKGIPMPDEIKLRLSKKMSGKGNPNFGKTESIETRSKISSTLKQRYKEGYITPSARAVKCIEDNLIFNSIRECITYYNITKSCFAYAMVTFNGYIKNLISILFCGILMKMNSIKKFK